MKILIKFPTRSRKEKFFKVLDMYYSFANNLDLIHFQISIDEDDLTMNNDEVISKFGNYKNLTCTVGKSESKIHAVNRDIIVSDWDIVLLASDDMIPKIKGYDDIVRTKMSELYPDTDGILWFNDGNRKDLNTLCILGREYYKRFNYIYHPDYKSLWADNEFMVVGNILKKQTFIDQVIIHHEHPDWGYGGGDQIHRLNSMNNNYDMQVFVRRQSNNFGL
jgi:hypothetical protein